ncbi:UDP-N-acetylmuramate--L-alanine ligase [Treponema brennaborense]|uniref:UDP-N-acetylmuramate--L-alanine ligase n=1 Tax=Treponema brennaborense (strain DSM 12168 / CIP 105900 / DD5/3) TaxID=906968 RepID=F4LL10_TREBD|nr:UDP-N-acetylmuramate--L-alanine ligase [Treponema brennaborense]AEE16607.1 UDP-N-acetylmuramate/alanine ligase [Treponema brennaborense DSM 12168]
MNTYVLPPDLNGIHIHCVGIKGTGMAALTEIMVSRGAVLTGSDVADVFYTDAILKKCGVAVMPFSAENITDRIDCVVYSSAYDRRTNPDLAEADRRGVPALLYSEALGQLSAAAYSCGIAGVHGKTTTTGLAGTILHELALPAQTLAGSVIASFGPAGGDGSCTLTDGHTYFVAETCEYQRHFMAFHPQKIILTSVESDHQDYYPTYESIRDAFVEYALKLPNGGELIYCADDAGAAETARSVSSLRPDILLTPYGEQAAGPFCVTFGDVRDGRQYFSLAGFDRSFYLCIPGRHLVRNAAAAAALACGLLKEQLRSEGVSAEATPAHVFSARTAEKLAAAFAGFRGGRRRSEIIGTAGNVVFIDDYGHHPTAVRTTLDGYRAFYPGRKLVVDFMSHTYTRTAALLDEFAQCFGAADEVILHKIYGSARENVSETGITGETLFGRTKRFHANVRYYAEIMDAHDDLYRELSSPDPAYPAGTVFVTMGAGDNWKIGKRLYDELKNIK